MHTTDYHPRASPGQAVASLSKGRGPPGQTSDMGTTGRVSAAMGGQGAPPVDTTQHLFFYDKPRTDVLFWVEKRQKEGKTA